MVAVTEPTTRSATQLYRRSRSLPTRFEIVGHGMSALSSSENAASSSGIATKRAIRPQNQ
jgi:hypothetical protein